MFGACVYNIGYVGASGCAGGWSSSDFGSAGALTRVSGQGGFGVRPIVQALYEARHTAIGRFGWVTDPEGNRVELWQAA